MFSRATKSIVKTIGQRKYHAGEENIKLAVIGGAGEIGRSLSQMLKRTSKLDVLALYDVASLNKRFSTPIKLNYFSNGEFSTNLSNSRMPTMLEKSRSSKADYRSENFQEPFYSNRAPKLSQNATEKFVESLCQLPIAEECATNQFSRPTMKSQGDHACARDLQGPRVLAEIGPASYRRDGGRIIAEIYKRFPDFAVHLNKARSSNDGVAPARRWYSNVVQSKLDQRAAAIADFELELEEASSRSATAKAEKTDRRSGSRKRDATKETKTASSEQTVERRLPKGAERRTQAMRKPDRTQRRNESRTAAKIEARSRNTAKSKNWTIPAALSDKKPKTLYGLVRHRREPFTSFFHRFFDVQSGEPADDRCSGKISKDTRKILEESNIRDKRSNVSTSVSDLASDLPEGVTSTDDAMPLEQTESAMTVERSEEEVNEDRATSRSESENENARKMSSEIALFLENLQLNRIDRRSLSVSSLTSYNLESLFTDLEPTSPTSNQPFCPASFFTSSSDSDCKPTIRDKILRKVCGKTRDRREDEICRRRECETEEASKSCGKKREEAPCGKRDEKRKPKCGDSDEDPCKPYRSEDRYGPTCKKYEEEPMAYDPCDKFWDDSIHGPRCKKPPKKKTDTCCQRKKSCDAKAKKKSKKCEKSSCRLRQTHWPDPTGVRTSTDSLGIAPASDRRNRGPLSITSNSITNHATKNQIRDDLADLCRGTVYFDHDRVRNDDYFPQGEEYEDEIGSDYGQMQRDFPSKPVSTYKDMNLNDCLLDGVGRERQLRLGEPDCGEESPDWPERNPCHPPKGPCDPLGPPGFPEKPKQKKKPFCARLNDLNATFLRPVLKQLSTAMFGNFRARSHCSLGSSLFDGCPRARNFSTTPVLPRESKNMVGLSKELTRCLWQGQARFFRNDSILTSKSRWRKPPPPSPSSDCSSKSAPDCTKQTQPRGQRQKPRIPSEPACRPRPKNSECLQPPIPSSPPCSTSSVKPAKECPPPKICYRKCPPPPRPPKPPKCSKIPAPPPAPLPPKVPKPPKCAPPCPPPPPPPLPKCPSAPKCPECPPRSECPPPPPCEPCPCPPPCPPSFCPPPPPCPPCPPHVPCPKPLPCPPPPSPAICPPCPSCPECPKSPPCPPPRSCCPCPCPKPPPPCPCPKPCQEPEPSCPKDVPSCPKNRGTPTMKVKLQKKKKKKEEEGECVYRCIRRGKCEELITAKPPKMEYKPVVCAPPKFTSPAPCPEIPDAVYETNLCPEIPSTKSTKEKQICVPPPMPEPPTKPVVLCPCPTPSKMHPGPCPCYNTKVTKPSKSTMPPCPRKQYICRRKEVKLCVLENMTCKKRKICDPERRKKKDE
ncbi:IgA FC receptor [Melipona quadrifasciata]|uniref:IgA FC receptor n=1 Tax=Melipona quadrifasciata TaxID=166423 RepID=A0A0N0U355_9HYME|nr:IgA FC receptor [Melipona quadrifasciata]